MKQISLSGYWRSPRVWKKLTEGRRPCSEVLGKVFSERVSNILCCVFWGVKLCQIFKEGGGKALKMNLFYWRYLLKDWGWGFTVRVMGANTGQWVDVLNQGLGGLGHTIF